MTTPREDVVPTISSISTYRMTLTHTLTLILTLTANQNSRPVIKVGSKVRDNNIP